LLIIFVVVAVDKIRGFPLFSYGFYYVFIIEDLPGGKCLKAARGLIVKLLTSLL
jgi:hypothetical protein